MRMRCIICARALIEWRALELEVKMEKKEDYEPAPATYLDDQEEGKKPVIRGGCTVGRVVNIIIIVNYLLVLLTALIVSGVNGTLNDKLIKKYPDHTNNTPACYLYSSCVGNGGACTIHYDHSGVCEFIIVGFGLVALASLIYIIVSIIRIIFSTDIYLTVIADIVVNVGMVIFVLVMGITLSVGLAFTCSQVNLLNGAQGVTNCSGRSIPTEKAGYKFYVEANVSQGAAWFCFLFAVISTTVFLVRLCIFLRRRAKIPSMGGNTEILAAEDNFDPREDDPPKPM